MGTDMIKIPTSLYLWSLISVAIMSCFISVFAAEKQSDVFTINEFVLIGLMVISIISSCASVMLSCTYEYRHKHN